MKMAVCWDAAPCRLVVLLVQAPSTSETSVNFYQTTRRNNPEDSHLHTCRRENLKSHCLSTFHSINVYKPLSSIVINAICQGVAFEVSMIYILKYFNPLKPSGNYMNHLL
jgi:hypothetical protein